MAELTGARKAAVLLLSLEQDEAAEILRRLSPEAIAEVSREIESMCGVARAERTEVLGEVFNLFALASSIGDLDLAYANVLLRKTVLTEDEVDSLAEQITQPMNEMPFVFSKSAGPIWQS